MTNKQEQLLQEWENHRKKVSTERIQTNIKQLQDWYLEENQSLIINPNFQRLYRWDKKQKSDLIESILLGIPIPPIFVAENLEGKYEVIDGLQRISTILEFLGVLKYEVKKEKSISNGLMRPAYLETLEGMKFEKLPEALQKRFLNTYRIDLNILTSESDISAKYELFNRLNSGGTALTQQEIRNTLLLQFKKEAYEKLKELSKNDDFIEIANITDGKVEVEKDTEMVLRFLALIDYDNDKSKIISVSNFIDDKMKGLIKGESIQENIFIDVFKILNGIEEGNILKRYNGEFFRGQVMIPGFDLIAGGIGFNIKNNNFNINNINKLDLIDRVKFIWLNENFNKHITTGNFIEHKLEVCLDIGRKLFNMNLSLEEIKEYIEVNWK